MQYYNEITGEIFKTVEDYNAADEKRKEAEEKRKVVEEKKECRLAEIREKAKAIKDIKSEFYAKLTKEENELRDMIKRYQKDFNPTYVYEFGDDLISPIYQLLFGRR